MQSKLHPRLKSEEFGGLDLIEPTVQSIEPQHFDDRSFR